LGAETGAEALNSQIDILKRKFDELLKWERRKRSEQILLTVACLALALAIVLAPLHVYLPANWLRWFVPPALLIGLAPGFFYCRRWRGEDATRTLVKLDRTLGLDARAVTAWELSARGDQTAPAALVFKQAEENLRTVEPRALFPRQWGWQAYVTVALLLFWVGVLWFDVDQSFSHQRRALLPQTLAQKLREFARDFQEKAKNEGLRESLKVGQQLEQVAQKNIDAKSGDDQLKKELAGITKKIDAAGKSGAAKESSSGAESQQSLKDLKAELEAARDMLNLPDAAKGTRELPQQWLDRLAALPQLKRQLDREQEGGQGLGQKELKSLLDRLDNQVSGELDRRALLDAQQFLEQMMKQGQGNNSENTVQMTGRGERDLADEGTREKNHSNLPGKQPGKKDDGFNSLPEFRGGARTQVKGLLSDGESIGIVFKGKPAPGKSELAQQEVVANYRRQAEQELNSERVPEALKETVRKYFLSLGEGNK
jgi:hypothetical protein